MLKVEDFTNTGNYDNTYICKKDTFDIKIKLTPVSVEIVLYDKAYLGNVYSLFEGLVNYTFRDDSDRMVIEMNDNTYIARAREIERIELNILVNTFNKNSTHVDFDFLKNKLKERSKPIRSEFIDLMNHAIDVNNRIVNEFYNHCGDEIVNDIKESHTFCYMDEKLYTLFYNVAMKIQPLSYMRKKIDKWERMLHSAVEKLKSSNRYHPFEEIYDGVVEDDARAWIRKRAAFERSESIYISDVIDMPEEYIDRLNSIVKFQSRCLEIYRGKF